MLFLLRRNNAIGDKTANVQIETMRRQLANIVADTYLKYKYGEQADAMAGEAKENTRLMAYRTIIDAYRNQWEEAVAWQNFEQRTFEVGLTTGTAIDVAEQEAKTAATGQIVNLMGNVINLAGQLGGASIIGNAMEKTETSTTVKIPNSAGGSRTVTTRERK